MRRTLIGVSALVIAAGASPANAVTCTITGTPDADVQRHTGTDAYLRFGGHDIVRGLQGNDLLLECRTATTRCSATGPRRAGAAENGFDLAPGRHRADTSFGGLWAATRCGRPRVRRPASSATGPTGCPVARVRHR